MKRKKLFLILGLIAVLVIAGLVLKNLFKPKNGNGFEFTEIKKGELENIVSSTGTLSAVETVEVGSQVSGIIEKILVDFNDSVKKGQVLAILDKTLFELSVKDAQARVFQARANLDQAEAEVKRNQPLFERGHISESEFLVIKTSARTAEANLEIAKATLDKAKTNLDYSVIRSPIDGTVIERTVDAGQTIAASFQAPKLFVIARDLTRMQIEAYVDESDIGQIKDQQAVQFSVQTYPEKNFTGTVRQIRLQPQTIQNVVNYTVIIDAPNQESLLLPGMTATVDFIMEQAKDVLMVSNKALNFTPPAEMLQDMFRRFMKNSRDQSPGATGRVPGASGSQSGIGTGSAFQLPEDVGRIFYLDSKNNLSMTLFKKGITDGLFTEIKTFLRTELNPGTLVITGIQKAKTAATENKNTLLMRPGRGPH
jgi:HlyD family secretion protein